MIQIAWLTLKIIAKVVVGKLSLKEMEPFAEAFIGSKTSYIVMSKIIQEVPIDIAILYNYCFRL